MTHVGSAAPGLRNRLFLWIRGHLIGEVPNELALGEFDCKRSPCPEEEWETCERRITRAAGELMPESPKGMEPPG
jgi:hypothetical protein